MEKKVKRTLSIVGIILFLAVIAIYGSQSFSVAGLDKDIVYTAQWSSAVCQPLQTDVTLGSYNIVGEEDQQLKQFRGTLGSDKFFAYRCGYGDLKKSSPDNKFYTRSCRMNYQATGSGDLNIYLCKGSFDYNSNPRFNSLCTKVDDHSVTSDIVKEDLKPIILSNDEGLLVPSELNEKETIVVFEIDDRIGLNIKLNIQAIGDQYGLVVKDGNGYTTVDKSGCKLTDILALDKVLPSTVQDQEIGIPSLEKEKLTLNSFLGDARLPYGGYINWIWAYTPKIGTQVINHPSLGKIYISEARSYIPVKEVDGIKIAYEGLREKSDLIECVPNLPGCSPLAKKITDPEKLECNDFKGFKSGEESLRSDGLSCIFSCVSGKPQFSKCKSVTEETCPDGELYQLNKGCVKVDNLINPPIIGGGKTDLTPLFIMGIAFLLVVILILVYQQTRGKRK